MEFEERIAKIERVSVRIFVLVMLFLALLGLLTVRRIRTSQVYLPSVGVMIGGSLCQGFSRRREISIPMEGGPRGKMLQQVASIFDPFCLDYESFKRLSVNNEERIRQVALTLNDPLRRILLLVKVDETKLGSIENHKRRARPGAV